jgi:predicted peroxiredoxin
LFFLEKRTTKVLFRKKNSKKIKKKNSKKIKKNTAKIKQEGVVGETWVSLRGWGGRGNLGFPTRMGW